MKNTLAVLIAFAAPGVPVASAQQTVPLRVLTPTAALDSGFLRLRPDVRALSNGGVIVNDLAYRRVLMFDAALKNMKVLADSTGNAPSRYSNNFGAIMPYLGDSTLFIDAEAQALIVIDPKGVFGRTMSAPKASDLRALSGNATTDPLGRLVYRVPRQTPGPVIGGPDTGKIVTAVIHDSAAIVRGNFETRAVDTAALLALPVRKRVSVSVTGGYAQTTGLNPLPLTDEWAMMSDGTIAVVRGQDYHVDWFRPDGSKTSSPKMHYDWKPVPHEEKLRMLDSAKAQMEAARAARGTGSGAGGGRGDGGGSGAGGSARGVSAGVAVNGAPPPPGAGGRPNFPVLPVVTVDPEDLPDYYPPIRAGTVKADPDGHLWILPTTSVYSEGGLTYDLVNSKGDIVERVKLPQGRSLITIGKGGVVYMWNAGRLERAVIQR
ncbi:MAG TPA: hypothetical protein VE967_05830 [Gemmatimonadaceae bacterium]|nr:hypothetical protein [Gemmatimonadaceae bacterium]